MNSKSKRIRIFQISETKTHQSYTFYKISCTTFPINCPEQANTVTTWKRFSQFLALFKSVSLVHKQLYLHGQFPSAPVTSYFNRKDPKVIELRRVWSLELLEFIASQPILNTHAIFTNFLFELQEEEAGGMDQVPIEGEHVDEVTVLGGGAEEVMRRDLSSPDVSGLQVVISPNTLDSTPTLTPSQVMATQEVEADSLDSLVVPQGSDDVPQYIKDAAENVSRALSAVADDDIEQSLASYRAAIGGLLSNVQSDPDPARQAKVKRRISQYISKAEKLVKKDAEMKIRKIIQKPLGIPHLQLFGQFDELKEYKVKNIIANKIILSENVKTGELVIFKTLHKSPAVYKKSKTSLLPINISHMVRLLKYFETDDCVYLMLEYCSVGCLWDIVQPLVIPNYNNVTSLPLTTSSFVASARTPVKRQTVLKPSESFIKDRKISLRRPDNCDETDSEEDMMIVHQTSQNSVVVFDSDNIQHIETFETAEKETNIVENDDGVSNVGEKLDDLETKIKRHIDSDFRPEQKREEEGESQETSGPEPAVRPRELRALSEFLPEQESSPAGLPDRLVRSWAAQLVQVLSSLHYREIIIKDFQPANILLDTNGHIKITYQCQWVSVDNILAPAALQGHYCAPEVIGVGDVTPAADWWSLGGILHLLYTGVGPSAVLGTGVDISIPLLLSEDLPEEVIMFVSQLLQPHPQNRLGAGSLGGHDVRQHEYFSGWCWDTMAWN